MFHHEPTATATSSKITQKVKKTSSSSSSHKTSTKKSTKIATTKVYTVEAGETIDTIATKFNTSSKKLKKLNPNIDWATLQIDQIIEVPNNTTSTTELDTTTVASDDSQSYVVTQGDTWYRVAVNNNLSVSELQNLNPNVTSLKTGEAIRVQ
ncbi:LysM peptidoglycan-binding domain-containing protein [Weissella koreensis]|uniref:LysM peptidoglycan-binding domain-containing protein n=1 Tax=Weissella koreensis TaxID=165096 RepID=UPI00026F3051|nr:hypothetical protein JC2156_13640 [Weissella koreensis KCTC 3621]